MHSTQLLIKNLLKYPLLVLLTVLLGFSGAIFNGVGTLLILPVLLELLGQASELKRNFPPVLRVFLEAFDTIPESYRLLAMAGSIFAMILLKNVSSYASALVSGTLNRKLATSMRRDGLRILLDVDLDFYSKSRVGDLINHLNIEVSRTTIAVRNIIKLATVVITIGVSLILLVVISWQLTLVSVVTLGSVSMLNKTVIKRSKQLGRRLSELSRAYSARVFEVISGIRLVKATANEDREYQVLDQLILEREQAEFKSQLIFAGIAPFNEVANILALLATAALGRFLFSEQLAYFSSVLLTYLILLFRTMPYVGQLNGLRSNLANTAVSVEIISQFLRRDDKPFMVQGYRPYKPLQTGIRFHRLSFQYPNHDKWVIKDVDLYLPKGKTLALVGSSGAGKSTLADLLPRFYDPNHGQIELDGIDIKEINLQSFRRNLGIVSQDTFLFNASVRDNLLYGRPEATEADLLDAAKRANAYEFIARLPKGMDTIVGDRGVMLSGGQRQRLAIARALLQDPDILILDEATSALDTISERLVQRALEDLSQQRTTLVIAHRLSTIQKADQIAVLDEGRVVETGTHLELLQKGGAYAKLYAMQFTESHKDNGISANGIRAHKSMIAKSSYELRSQLNAMIGVLGLLSDSDDDVAGEQEELTQSAYAAALDMLSVVESLEREDGNLQPPAGNPVKTTHLSKTAPSQTTPSKTDLSKTDLN
ncbi:MAG: ABC transporter ATP-binding protein [Cyanobacteria bacterium J06635_1]